MRRPRRLPWALRAPVRLLARPIRRPGLPRLVWVTFAGPPRTLRQRTRAIRLLKRMYHNHGLTAVEAEQLIALLDAHPRVTWSNKIPIVWKDAANISHIRWWNAPENDHDS